MWFLYIIVVHVSIPSDIPGKILLEFKTEKQCIEALNSISYWTKFNWFKVEGKCYESTKIDPKIIQGMSRPRQE
jgi:hypothetical protein